MAWTTPKTDWATDDAVGTTDLNRIEENTQEVRTPTEGTNARMGVKSCTAGDNVVLNTSVTANTRIFLARQNYTGSTGNDCWQKARSAGASFTIYATDTMVVAWLLIEPHA